MSTGALDRFEIEIVTTLDDQIAFSLHMLASPPLSTMRRRRELIALATSPLWFVGGILGAWLIDGDRLPFRDFVTLALEHPALAIGGLLFAFAMMAFGIGLNRYLARRRVVSLLRRTLRDQADVDPADPTLAQRTRSVFDDAGIRSETTLGQSLVKWVAIKRLDETAGHLFMISGPFSGFMVPKRQLDGEQLGHLRALISARLARA